MDLSRRDAFRPCPRDSLGDKVNFVLLAKKKLYLFLLESAPLTVSWLYLSSCAMVTPKLFAYNLQTSIYCHIVIKSLFIL